MGNDIINTLTFFTTTNSWVYQGIIFIFGGLAGLILHMTLSKSLPLCFFTSEQKQLPRSLLELCCALTYLGLSILMDVSWTLLWAMILAWFLVALIWIDISCYLLPDKLTLPLLWIGIISHSFGSERNLYDAVYGAVLGYLVLWGFFWGFKLTTGRNGMGYGDFKLLAALGAWVGWQQLPLLCTIAALTGISYFSLRCLISKKAGMIPFGPCLALAGFAVYISQNSTNLNWLMNS